VAGDNSKNGAVGVQPTRRIRPHWWAVLAVSVSLLALVAATSSHPNTSAGPAAAHRPSARHQSTPTTATPTTTTTTTTTTEVQQGPNTVTPPTSSSSPGSASTVGAHVVVRESTATSTTTTTTTTTATTGGSSVAAAVQPVTPLVEPGDLQQPDDASASYPFTGVGSMRVSASSTSTVPLLLTVTCPEGTVDQAGSSLVAVVIPNADGPCDVVLKETVVQYVAVPYTLTIGPEGG
jgi:hypothetical protein